MAEPARPRRPHWRYLAAALTTLAIVTFLPMFCPAATAGVAEGARDSHQGSGADATTQRGYAAMDNLFSGDLDEYGLFDEDAQDGLPGSPTLAAAPPPGPLPGLRAEYFALAPGAVRRLAEVDFDAEPDAIGERGGFGTDAGDAPEGLFAARYSGTLTLEAGGRHLFHLGAGAQLYVDGVRVLDTDRGAGSFGRSTVLDLAAGSHSIEILHLPATPGAPLQLDWQTQGSPRSALDGAVLSHADPVMAEDGVMEMTLWRATRLDSEESTQPVIEQVIGAIFGWLRALAQRNARQAEPEPEPVAETEPAPAPVEEPVAEEESPPLPDSPDAPVAEDPAPEAAEEETRLDETGETGAADSGSGSDAQAEEDTQEPDPAMPELDTEDGDPAGEDETRQDGSVISTPPAEEPVAETAPAPAPVEEPVAEEESRPLPESPDAPVAEDPAPGETEEETRLDGSGETGSDDSGPGSDAQAGDDTPPVVEEPVVEEPGSTPEAGAETPQEPLPDTGTDDAGTGPSTGGGSVAPPPSDAPVQHVQHQMELSGGRVTTIRPEGDGIVAVSILSRPEHGHLSVNPDNSLALVMTLSDHVGPLAFSYETLHADGSRSLHEVSAEVLPGVQEQGWGTGIGHYMLAVGEDDRVVVEHGENHRKVYVSGSDTALTAADIAAREGVSESTVTARWLESNAPQYGASEDLALSTELGMALWNRINPRDSVSSNWLLFERGYSYDDTGRVFSRGVSGESELHPLYIGAWGEGARPVLTEHQRMFQNQSKNVVAQDVDFVNGLQILGLRDARHENVLFDGVGVTGHEINIQRVEGITFRNSIIHDIWRDEPRNPDAETWSPHSNRMSGLFISDSDSLLLDGVVVDRNGWAPDFRLDASTEGGHPPSMYSHNLYIQWNVGDVTMRDSVTMQGASYGAQFRGGAFLDGNLFLDNNAAFNVLGGDAFGSGPVMNYSLLLGNLVTQAANRGEGLPNIGALDWGINNSALLTTLIGNIVAHAGDPNDDTDTTAGRNALRVAQGEEAGIAYDDTIIWRWGPETINVEGLDPAALNQITIQLYTAALLGKPDATVADFAAYMRGLDPTEYAAAVQDVLAFFRDGFGIGTGVRDEAATLRFVPDDRGDGVRWDNRLNWDSGDLPGSVAGDSVDLGGNTVVFGGTVKLQDLHLGDAGGLIATHGRLDVTGALTAGTEGATLEIARAGQVWINGYEGGGLLDITVDGGRFVNTGTVLGPVDLTASAGQTILAGSGGVFAASAGSRIEIVGYEARVGFDGNDGGMALLGFDAGATLAFTATAGGLGGIAGFRSGAFGETPDLRAGVDLGGAALEIDLSALLADTGEIRLLDAGELVGSFGSIAVTGLADRDAEIVIDYETDAVWLRLTEGSGASNLSHVGSEDMVSAGHEDLWTALMQGAALGQTEAWDL